MTANRKYKDSVFSKLCEDKKRLLEIYNAVAGKNYPPDTEIEMATLDDALFLDRRNDVAFVVENKLVVLMEHQSTPCENMPVRLLIYVARVYEKLFNIDPKLKQAIYKMKLLKIPKPEFYVLYNGSYVYRPCAPIFGVRRRIGEGHRTDRKRLRGKRDIGGVSAKQHIGGF